MQGKKTAVTAVKWLPIRAVMGLKASQEAGIDGAAESESDEIVSTEKLAPRLKSSGDKKTRSIEEEFDMDNYDNEGTEGLNYFSHIDADVRLNSTRDPAQNYEEASDSEDDEFYTVKPSDLMFVAANAEEDQCYVDVYVHDTVSYGLFVRQNFDLNAYPLCLEFVSSFKNREDSCMLAVGTFDPAIELWDLSSLVTDEPLAVLGQSTAAHASQPSRKGKKGKKTVKIIESHSDAVLALHSCPTSRHALASGSADHTVRVWDLNTCNSVCTLQNSHSDKVQAVQWHPTEGGILASAGYDRALVVEDVRASTSAGRRTRLTTDPEALLWKNDIELLVSTEDGKITCFDTRKFTESKKAGLLWSLDAHSEGACTSMALGGDVLVTGGVDGIAKVWKFAEGKAPTQIKQKPMGTGPLFSIANLADSPSFFAFGGAEAGIWNVTQDDFDDEGARPDESDADSTADADMMHDEASDDEE